MRTHIEAELRHERVSAENRIGEAKTADVVVVELKRFATQEKNTWDDVYWTYRGSRLFVEPRADGRVKVGLDLGRRCPKRVWPDEMKAYFDIRIDYEDAVKRLGEERNRDA